MKKSEKKTGFSYYAAIFFLIVCCFTLPLSSSLMGGTAVLAFIFWLCSGRIFQLPELIRQHPAVGLAIALFLLFVVGIFYSPVDIPEAILSLKKYRELLFFAMVLSLVKDNEDIAGYAENSFLLGCILLLTLSYLMYFRVLPMEKYGYSTVYHITHSFFMAILAFWCAQKLFDSLEYVYIWAPLFIAACVNLFFISPGRTGMLIFITLAALTIFQRFTARRSLLAFIVACLVIAGTYLSSDNFSTRVNEAINEVKIYNAESSRTSLGMRFDWWQNSIHMIEEKPFFGHGTGSFETVQQRLIAGTKTQPTDNPHNEYLFVGTQIGLVGTALFILFLLSLFISSFKLERSKRYLLQGVVVTMSCGCLMNSFLYDSHEGHFFTIISAILCSRAIPHKQEQNNNDRSS